MYCHRPVADERVALCSTFYVYPSLSDGNWNDKAMVTSYSINDREERNPPKGLAALNTSMLKRAEIKVKVVYHRRCMEKILTNPRGPYDPEVVQSMYEEYREQLLERFEERKPGQVRFASGMRKVPDGGRDGAEVQDTSV